MRTISVDVDLSDLDQEELVEDISTTILIRELGKRKYDNHGQYYTMAIKECISNLEYFHCPPEILESLKEWNKTPFADKEKLEKWVALTK